MFSMSDRIELESLQYRHEIWPLGPKHYPLRLTNDESSQKRLKSFSLFANSLESMVKYVSSSYAIYMR